MKLFRFNPIKSKDELFEAIKHIHHDCHKLCKRAFGEYFEVSGNIGVFCHTDEEYEFLTKLRKEMTEASDNPTQKYFQLLKPLIIPAQADIPQTVYTHLYIRKPDPTPYGRHSGDVDFVLEDEEYKRLKKKVSSDSKPGIQMYDRPGWDTIQISDPEIDAVAYVSTKEFAEKVRFKF